MRLSTFVNVAPTPEIVVFPLASSVQAPAPLNVAPLDAMVMLVRVSVTWALFVIAPEAFIVEALKVATPMVRAAPAVRVMLPPETAKVPAPVMAPARVADPVSVRVLLLFKLNVPALSLSTPAKVRFCADSD